MLCPFCSFETTKVLESRSSSDRKSTRRRRECERCNKRFTTYERLESTPATIIKKDGLKEDYSVEKLTHSIKKACYKSSITIDKVYKIINDIESELTSIGKKEVTSNLLGSLVLNELKMIDKVAYIRYACIYNEYKNIEDFINEAQLLINEDSE